MPLRAPTSVLRAFTASPGPITTIPTLATATITTSSMNYPTISYTPRHSTWPYAAADFTRADPSPDTSFYRIPRFVTHIDDSAIAGLQAYYAAHLPATGRILDLCSSWISHLPAAHAAAARPPATGGLPPLEVVGIGLNAAELAANPALTRQLVHDLNAHPDIATAVPDADKEHIGPLDAAICAVSIDYLTDPQTVLRGVLAQLRPQASLHCAVSNRCFPTKAVARWLRVGEAERLRMVGDYLWFAGFRDVELVTVCDGNAGDPLWVVRGRKEDGGSDGT